MESPWLTAYLVLVGLAVVQALTLGVQTWEHRRYARSCMRQLDRHRPTGCVAVFAPCKGVDVGLESNLHALLRQDYPDFEVVFIVEDADDPAVEVIDRVVAEHPHVATRLVIAGRATGGGQKVHNLRTATAAVPPEVEFLAFVDSDARPRPQWLRVLVARLSVGDVGAVTGYRWFVPARGSLANHLLYSMNCEIMSLLGRDSHYLVWGGSWGIRRSVFESVGLHAAWAGTLSDDLTATRQLRRASQRVWFEPGCVVASPLDGSLGQMFSFVRRQYQVARFYVPDWWAMGLAAATFANLVWLTNLAVLARSLAAGSPPVWIPAVSIAILYLLGAVRGRLRQDLVATYFPQRREELRGAIRFDVWAGPLVRLAHWLGILGSLVGRNIVWRGVTYRVARGGRIDVATPAQPARSEEADAQPACLPLPVPPEPRRRAA